ncbi:MAG TPA: hypothetical protein VLT90_04515 [Terriglobales bacterium]|nr:hypothetical protein [Terriglobales bacterium]
MNDQEKERAIEQWLDSAIAQYSKAKPRDGLEGRILANLRAEAEKDRLATQRRWWWMVGVAAVAVVVVAVWVGLRDTRRVPSRTAIPPTTHREEASTSTQTPPSPPVTEQTKAVVRGPRRRVTSVVAKQAKEPKLDQFPSPLPLNDQEKMLTQYVREFPERAVLVARAQTLLRKQEEREMTAPIPQSPTSSDQPE